MSRYLVKPKEPTVLSHKKYHEVSSTHLFLSWTIPTAQIIPEILDIDRFNFSLSRALSSFPHIAGRLARPATPDASWVIRLTNSGVPVSVVDSDADEVVPTDFSIQTQFRLVEPLNVARIVSTEGESDEPLFRVSIIRFKKLNSTSIGACFSHVLLDGYGYVLFLDFVSQFYQGLDPPLYYLPDAIKFPDPSRDPQPLYKICDPSVPHPSELSSRKAMDFVAIRLTATQLAEIHGTVTQGKEHRRVSKVDMVVGLLARCLSEVEPESKSINTIVNFVNHRGMGIYPHNAVVYSIIWHVTNVEVSKPVDPRDSVLICATKIRESLCRLENPGFIKDTAADVAKIQSRIAWDKRFQDTSTAKEPGCLIVNNTWKPSGTGPHFGHPGKVMIYLGHVAGPRSVKIMRPNPVFKDGAWISREGDMELTFYVPHNRGRRSVELFEGYAKMLGMTGQVYHYSKLGSRGLSAKL